MVSVVLRNRNEEQHIGLSIQSVIDSLGLDCEIILVDNNSTDESLQVAGLFDMANIKYFNLSKNYTPGKALNLGVEKATNETILILSAHAQITKLNINIVEEYLSVHKAVFGHQTPIYRGKKISPRYIWSHFTENEVVNMYSNIENRLFLHNAFCFYNKSFLLDNPFDNNLSGKEDRYWAKDIVDQGFSYLYTNLLRVNHYWTPNGATWKGLG